ncbi:GNAT family N-acetyltransferase [Vallitalea okinawensis]|uniref:GNAT family N-acetyltransferase n=1 Tax=Vallitalea okinawensis TaxID=2078660 RepID=UPI000CFBE6DF|nr:GNAT family N-acetyltransferase [Vallitalea okinawensis]
MKFKSTEEQYEYHLVDEDSKILAKGYIYESESSKFYKVPRMNYYIEYEAVVEDTIEVGKAVVKGLIDVAKIKRKCFDGFDARVYHCCFAENLQAIEFYNTIEGFYEDEGMHILELELRNIHRIDQLDEKYSVVENLLSTENDIEQLIECHSRVFRPGLYIIQDIIELKEKDGFKCISVYKKDKLVANLLVYIDEGGIGVLEDLFVMNNERQNGIGKYLVDYCSHYMLSRNVKRIQLEVWSNNDRAMNLYKSKGYQFKRISEVSIGMSI